ncbi:MAG: MATE family efflux transporter [Spirochaetia bacterium]|nr:MATE family efflux transporter [Spirochaetota bacterium]MDW8112973.1 MATE family efflux transporter [Spirochaetia bacterium]
MNDLTKGNVIKQLLVFSTPVILSDLIQALMSLVDMFYLGRLMGYNAVASVSVAIPVVFILFAILIGVGVSSNILVAQAFGAGSRESLISVIKNSLSITLLLSVVLSVLGFLTSGFVLKLMNVPDSIYKDALIYLQIYIAGIPITAMLNWITGITRGLGNSKVSLYFSIFMLLGKLILTPLFINGFYIIPQMGVTGAIVSTIIIELILVILGFIYISRRYEIIRQSVRFSIQREMIYRFFSLGLPVSLQMIIISFSFAVVMGFVSSFGDKSIAVFGIGNRIDQFAFLPALSLGLALMTISSQNLSAERYDRVFEFLKWALIISLGISGIVVVVSNLFAESIFGFFVSDREVISLGVDYIRVMSISYVLMGVVFSIQGIIRGAGDTLAVLIIKSLSMLVVRIPVAYVLGFLVFKSPVGVWASFVVVMLFEVIVSWIYLRSENWKKKIVFKRQDYVKLEEAKT